MPSHANGELVTEHEDLDVLAAPDRGSSASQLNTRVGFLNSAAARTSGFRLRVRID
jgi:hypothetical protein